MMTQHLKSAALCLMLTALFACNKTNADVVIDLSNLNVDGEGDVLLLVENVFGIVTDVSYDFSFNPTGDFSGSRQYELEIDVTAPDAARITGGSDLGGGGPYDVEFGGIDSTSAFAFAGNSGLLNGNSSSGTWTIRLADNFDNPGIDGTFDPNSRITISGVNVVPEPTSVAFLGIAALGMIARRRR